MAGDTVTDLKMRPLADRVLVRPLKQEEVTAGGLVLPDTAQEKPQQGEILAAGPGAVMDNGERRPLEVKVGEKVLYSKYAGTEVKIGGETYLILSERDILAVVE